MLNSFDDAEESTTDYFARSARKRERRENELLWALYRTGAVDTQRAAGEAAICERSKQPSQSRCSQIIREVDETIPFFCLYLREAEAGGPDTVDEAERLLDEERTVGPFSINSRTLENWPAPMLDALRDAIAQLIVHAEAVERLAKTSDELPEWAGDVLEEHIERDLGGVRAELYRNDEFKQKDVHHSPAMDVQERLQDGEDPASAPEAGD